MGLPSAANDDNAVQNAVQFGRRAQHDALNVGICHSLDVARCLTSCVALDVQRTAGRPAFGRRAGNGNDNPTQWQPIEQAPPRQVGKISQVF